MSDPIPQQTPPQQATDSLDNTGGGYDFLPGGNMATPDPTTQGAPTTTPPEAAPPDDSAGAAGAAAPPDDAAKPPTTTTPPDPNAPPADGSAPPSGHIPFTMPPPVDYQAVYGDHPSTPPAGGPGSPNDPSIGGSDTGYAGATSASDFLPPASGSSTSDAMFGNDRPQYLTNTADMPTSTDWTVTPDQTVQGQLTQVLTNISQSPLYASMQDSLVRAQASAGGGNSLMAQSAAYDKVVQLGFQIASTDAATYANSAEFNASMANQFGLANQRFMQEALLSDQNFRQAGVLQTAQIAGQVHMARIQSDTAIRTTTIDAGSRIAAANISVQGQLAAISATHANDLQTMDIQHQYTQQTMNQSYGQQYALNVQQDSAAAQLQYGQETTGLLQQQIAAGGAIGATPGLTPAQQNAAFAYETDQTNHAMNVVSSLYGGGGSYPLPGTPGGAPLPSGGGAPGAPPGEGSSYNGYGNYMSYTAPNWTGTSPGDAGAAGAGRVAQPSQPTSSGGSGFNYQPPSNNPNPNFLPDGYDADYISSMNSTQYQQYRANNSQQTDIGSTTPP